MMFFNVMMPINYNTWGQINDCLNTGIYAAVQSSNKVYSKL